MYPNSYNQTIQMKSPSSLTEKAAELKSKLDWSSRRQYFRLVTSQVSVWYADHSTPNPLTALPKNVEVIRGDKFRKKPVAGGSDQRGAMSKAEKSSKK